MITRGWLRAGIPILVLLANPFNAARADGPGLQRGIDALHAGNAKLAIKLLTTELETPPRSSVDLARALYFRAKAHLADRQTARAMADANAALWLRKLSPSEIADAENIKAQVLKAAGVPNTSPTIASTAAAPVTPTPSAPEPILPKEAGGKLPEKAEPLPDHAPAARPMPTWSTANVKPIDLPPPDATRAPAPTQAASPAPRQLAPAWSTAAIQREDLPQVAVPSNTSPIAEPSRGSPVETGSIAVSKSPSEPQAAPVAPQHPISVIQQPRAADPASASPSVVSAPVAEVPAAQPSGSFLPAISETIGMFYQPQPSRVQADIERANEFERSYLDKIRLHNRELAARRADAATTTASQEGKTEPSR